MSDTTLIQARFDDLKEHVTQSNAVIVARLDSQCDNCTNAATFKEKFRNQWTAIVLLFVVLGSVIGVGYQHVTMPAVLPDRSGQVAVTVAK